VTRRLTLSILSTVWAILIVGGGVAVLTTRYILIQDLDHTLQMQALISAKSEFPADYPDLPTAADARVYMLELRRRVSVENGPPPEILRRAFTDNGLRTMTVRVHFPNGFHDVIVSLPADQYQTYMNTMLLTLGGFILVAGVIVAAVARAIARSALKPLTTTAETLGAINERRLDRRIDVAALPEELRPVAQRLNEMIARLEASFTARRQFLADASHELRTPVAALVTSLEVSLARPRTAAQYEEIMHQALADAQYLQQLSESLLEAARSERDSAAHLDPVDVSSILAACCDLLAPLAAKYGLTLQRNISPDIVQPLDQRRLRSIAINLVSNALEYNRPHGSVSFEAFVGDPGPLPRPVGDASAPTLPALIIRVRDTGVGIAPENLPRIFDPFFRVDEVRTVSSLNRTADSLHMGLGLALIRRHVDAMGGALHVASEIQQGTTFTALLPISPIGKIDKIEKMKMTQDEINSSHVDFMTPHDSKV
jgi:signal transduction histidine kinase